MTSIRTANLISLFVVTVLLSQKSSAQWEAYNSGLTNRYVSCLASARTASGNVNLLAGTSGGGVFLSTNNGDNWVAVGYQNQDVLALLTVGSTVFAGTNGAGILMSSDAGVNWYQPTISMSVPIVYALSVCPIGSGGSEICAGAFGGGFYVSNDTGKTWMSMNKAAVEYYCLASNDSSTIFCGTTNGVYKSTTGGISWTPTTMILNTRALTIIPPSGSSQNSILVAGTLGSGVWLSSNSGDTWWYEVGSGVRNSFVQGLTLAPSIGVGANPSVFAATQNGVYVTTNNGVSWLRIEYGLQMANTRTFLVVGDQIYLATWGAGIWRRALSNVTDVQKTVGTNPDHFSLGQNYPNPFNPSTTIRYELPKSANVTLRIFNMLGQVVATLVDGHKEAGYYQTTWNAAIVPSGIYFYRLQAGEFVETKKAILLK